MPSPKLAEGDIVRLTRVDNCGRPVEGADNAVISECWASLQMSPNVNQGNDIEFINMRGQTCGFKRGCPDFRGFDITATFYEASPEQIEILTGNPVYFDFNGDPIGWDDCQVACADGFAIEMWEDILTDECAEGVAGEWFYWLLPWLSNGVLGDLTVDDEGLTFTLTANTRGGKGWELGPWDIQAQDGVGTEGPLLTPLGDDCHRRAFITTIEPPVDVDGYLEVPVNNTVS